MEDKSLERPFDISTPRLKPINVFIDGELNTAFKGETVLSALMAQGKKAICLNDHNQITGAYCGMGVCFSCMVIIDNQKRRSCKTIIEEGMVIDIEKNTEDLVNHSLTKQH